MTYNGVVKGNVITSVTLKEWLRETRQVRAQLSKTSDSVDILRQLREMRARR